MSKEMSKPNSKNLEDVDVVSEVHRDSQVVRLWLMADVLLMNSSVSLS